MLLSDLVAVSAEVRGTRSRLRKRAVLAEALGAMDSAEIPIGVAYLSGELPQGRLGLGYSTVYGTKEDPAADDPGLTLADVDAAFTRLQATSGPGSQKRRRDLLAGLLGRATEPEQQFLRRLLLRELRQGALEAAMTEAIAAVSGAPDDAVRRAHMLSGSLTEVATAAISEGPESLRRFHLTLRRPVRPMLAGAAADLEAALDRHSPAAFEVKFDGARVQVHKDGDDVAVYTRNLREVTDRLPEIVESASTIGAAAAILDGEVVALDRGGKPRPFQVTMSRFGRKLDIAAMRASTPLSVFYFDCLHVDGTDLIDLPASARWDHVDRIVPAGESAPRLITADLATAQRFFEETLASGHEGLMVKALDAPYAAGRRGSGWLKVKPAQTLDLVVLAAEWGSGRRQGLLSNLHLGARDSATGDFVMLGKTFKGLTDAMLARQTERFLELELRRERHIVFVRPEQVVEIAFDGIQASSRYPGGMALRFARVKGYRDDKSPEEADTIDAVREIFER